MAAALLGAAAVGLLAVALLTDDAVTVSAPVLVGDLGVVTANNSPQATRSPTNPDNVVVVNRVDRPGFSAAVSASTDGGRTWTTATPPLPGELDRPYAPSAAFGPDGTLYLSYVNLVGRGNRPETLWVTRSTDGGRTFDDPVRVTGTYVFQNRLVVDPATGTLHVTWAHAERLSQLAFDEPPRIMASHSTDGGRSWSEPVRVSDADRRWVGAAVPVVTSDGELVVVYEDFKDDARDFRNLEGPAYPDPFGLVAARSTDGGATFTEGVEFESDVQPLERFLAFLPVFPSVASGPGGRILVTWADGRNGDMDVFLRESADGGRSWSDPVRVNDNRLGDGTDQELPAVDVAPDGRVDVLYLDGRDDPTGVMARASLAFARDARRFRTLFVSPLAFDTGIGPRAADHLPTDLGSRQDVSSGRRSTLVAWTDTELGTQTTGRQDVATRRVTIPSPPVGPLGALLGALGLLLTGLAVLWAWRRRA